MAQQVQVLVPCSFHCTRQNSFHQNFPLQTSDRIRLNGSGRNSPLDAKQQEMKENLTVLRVQVTTAKEELENLNQQAKTYKTLASLRSRVCVTSALKLATM